jgi:hypothetical protein
VPACTEKDASACPPDDPPFKVHGQQQGVTFTKVPTSPPLSAAGYRELAHVHSKAPCQFTGVRSTCLSQSSQCHSGHSFPRCIHLHLNQGAFTCMPGCNHPWTYLTTRHPPPKHTPHCQACHPYTTDVQHKAHPCMPRTGQPGAHPLVRLTDSLHLSSSERHSARPSHYKHRANTPPPRHEHTHAFATLTHPAVWGPEAAYMYTLRYTIPL